MQDSDCACSAGRCAGIVRLLRKIFMQLSAKNREFVALSLKFEKGTAQQVRLALCQRSKDSV